MMYWEKLMPVRRAVAKVPHDLFETINGIPDLEARVHRNFPSVVKSVFRKLLLYSQSVCKSRLFPNQWLV
jgi:hypothetical protein